MADFFAALSANMVLMASLTAWVLSQGLKILHAYFKYSEFKIERLMGAGGMPSSHTSLVVCLAAAVGFKAGFASPGFAVAFVLAGIVMYDAAGVRRAAGKQARVINKLVQEMRIEHRVNEKRLKELLGHTPLEVLIGALLGFCVAYLFHRFY